MEEKECVFCGKIFNNLRKNGKGKILGKQWESIKCCSNLCGVRNRNKNRYKTDNEITYIYTNKNEELVVDTEDIIKVKKFYWSIGDNGYACTYSDRYKNGDKKYLMHHYIVGKPKKGYVTDHKNGNKKDNRKSNLRFVEHYVNNINKNTKITSNTGIKGVSYTERLQRGKYLYKKYRAEISINNVIKSKLFNTLDEAITWRKELENELYIKTGYRLVK